MAQQDRSEIERRDPMDEDLVGRAEDEEFDEAEDDQEEEENEDEDL